MENITSARAKFEGRSQQGLSIRATETWVDGIPPSRKRQGKRKPSILKSPSGKNLGLNAIDTRGGTERQIARNDREAYLTLLDLNRVDRAIVSVKSTFAPWPRRVLPSSCKCLTYISARRIEIKP